MSNPPEHRAQALSAPAFRDFRVLAAAADAEFRHVIESPPVRPSELDDLLERARDGLDCTPPDLVLAAATRALRGTLYCAPGHERQAELLWREALATALYAGRIARTRDLSCGAACVAGLFHRAGEALALQCIGRVEQQLGSRLDAGSRSRLISQSQRALAEALLRAWQLPTEICAAALGWQQLGALGVAGRECMAVYFGHLLAVESLFPEFCTESLADSLGADLGFDGDNLRQLRTQGVKARELLLALG